MQIILFTKMLRGKSVEEVGKHAAALGCAGLDLAVREGQCCSPTNVGETLPGAVATWKKLNVTVPMVSLEPTPTDPSSPITRDIFAACREAGIPNIKLGYWGWEKGEDYWKKFDLFRHDLDLFQKMGREYGVCCLLHTHSGNCYGSNASSAMHLVRGFDPKYMGVYLDPAHLSLNGERWPMATAMVGDYLKAIGVKAVNYQPNANPTGPRFHTKWTQLEEGLVYWPDIVAELRAQGKDLPMSIHAEYSREGMFDALAPYIQRDVNYLQSVLKQS